MKNHEKPIPFGCFLVIVLGFALYFTFKGDSPEEKKSKEEDSKILAAYKSKFNFDIDSLAKTIKPFYYESNKEKIKEKCLLLVEQEGKYLINIKRLTPVPDDLIAFNLKDLKTIIFQKFETVRTSGFAERTVEHDQVELSFYDIESSQIVYKTTVASYGSPNIIERGRRAGAKTYFLHNEDIINEILKVVRH